MDGKQPVIRSIAGGSESLTWTFENLVPLKFEAMGQAVEKLLPAIMAAPSDFEYEHYVGNMSTWQEFGKWILLIKQRQGRATRRYHKKR